MHLIKTFAAVIGLSVLNLQCSHPLSAETVPEKPTAGKQSKQIAVDPDQELSYLIYLPESYEDTPEKDYPLVLFLHGRGESHGPLELVAKWGPPKFAQRGDSLPFILVSPQCPSSGSWRDATRQTQLDQLLKTINEKYRVDQSRTYLTGLSMGGYGSWTLAANYPRRFAAVIPICGGGNPEDADKLKNTPIWVFHGDQDKAVPFEKSLEMVKAIKESGGDKIRFTSLENVGHNSWSSAYALPELYDWMLRFRTE